jgi:dienelactone hydrolase
VKQLIVLFVLAWGCAAQEKFIYPAPAPTQFTVQKDLVYRRVAERELKFDLYRPASASKPLPVILFLDAFGGQSQRDWVIYTGWAKASTAHGFAAINADTHTEGVADDLDALAGYLRQNSAEFNIDSGRIAVYAASGNAYRGLPITEDPKRNWIQAAAIYYGAADIAQFRREVPLLLVRAGLDRPQMNRLIDEAASKAIRQNVTVAVVNFAAGHHGFEVIDDNDAGRDVIEQTFQFFRKSLDSSWRAAFASGQEQAEAAGAVSLGDYERAAVIYGRLVNVSSGATMRLAYGEALLGAKRYRDARSQFDRASQLGGLGARDLGVPAAMASALDGDGDAAMKWLKTIPRQYLPASLQQNAAFEKLRLRPDFQALFEN